MPRTLIVIYDIFYANITQNRHGGAAWTLPPVKPVVESSPADASQSLSFAAIQKLQLDEAFMPGNDKRSLLEIQEEPDHWFAALTAITGEGPVQPQHDFDEAVEAWLEWGRQKGII